MLGAILGDIIGSRFEFSNTAINKDFKLYTKDSTYTDDTVMTLAIADALMCVNNRYDENEVKKMIIQKMKEYGHRYPLAGYGYSFSKWLFSESDQPYGSYGNGSAMRVSAIGYIILKILSMQPDGALKLHIIISKASKARLLLQLLYF